MTKPDTIAALASGPGRAGVAVIRLSGPAAGAALEALAGAKPKPRQAALRILRDQTGEPIDQALVLWFPAPHSFTGEDVAELHVHGGPAIIAATLQALTATPGVRLAGPGEFTRRAFEHGKLDLTQAEAIADLVDAETEGQRRQALRQLEGALSTQTEAWRARLLAALALLEAAIDFPDEDLPEDLAARVAPILAALADDIAAALTHAARGARIRDGYRIAILGAPNAGKSSLLNALAGREAAIVSPIPGTTRDVVEVRLVLAGFPVWIADTAGLREAADAIEAEGIKRARARAEEADLRLGLVEAGTDTGQELIAALREGDLIIRSKADLAVIPGKPQSGATRDRVQASLTLSTLTGAGLADLIAWLEARIAADLAASEAPVLTRARHAEALRAAEDAIRRALSVMTMGAELAAEDLRLAARAIGGIAGRIDVEEILGEIFASFCIGK